MNKLKLKTGYEANSRKNTQLIVDTKVIETIKELQNKGIKLSEVYTVNGSLDFIDQSKLIVKGYNYIIYLRGLKEDIVIQRNTDYKDIIIVEGK